MKSVVTRAVVLSLALVIPTAAALAQDDQVAQGENVFKKCKVCHQVGDGAANKVGPILNNLFGRVAGTEEGFKYSDAMVAKGQDGLIWTPEILVEYLEKPRDFVPGTKMAFAGLADIADREAVAAYLLTFSPDYVPAEGDAAMAEGDAATTEGDAASQ